MVVKISELEVLALQLHYSNAAQDGWKTVRMLQPEAGQTDVTK